MLVTFQTRPEDNADGIVTFDDPTAYARTIRATAVVFEDPRSQEIHERIQRLSQSDATVLVVGETGTGKELVARKLHRASPRAAGPFIAVNCAALPEHLVESELFGHEKGAFTGAIAQKKGWFETATGGTLFLDEIGDLPLATQVKMLRVLQEREISRVGSRASIPIDVRFLAATNVHLEDAVRAGRFREDLYYRLNVARLNLPPLRERKGDILPLAEYFLRLYRERLGLAPTTLSLAAREALLEYPWPGNIRELENSVQHALLVVRDNTVQPRDLNLTGFKLSRAADTAQDVAVPQQTVAGDGSALTRAVTDIFKQGGAGLFEKIEGEVVRAAFAHCNRNQVKTAQLLGVTRNVARHKLKHYGLIA
jgi:sigma-54-specific transcriptional regulator